MSPDKFLWFNQTGWAGVSAIVAALTLVGAFFAVMAAFKQVGAVRRAHEDQTRPHIVVDFESSVSWWSLIDLVIRNIGQSSAVDVRISIDPRPVRSKESEGSVKFADLRMLNEAIPTVAPGRELRLFFDSMVDRHKTDLPMVYTATVSYGSRDSKHRWEEKHILDLNVQTDTEQITIYGMHDAAKALRDIRDALKRSPLIKGPIEAIVEDRQTHVDRLRDEREARTRYIAERRAVNAAQPEASGQEISSGQGAPGDQVDGAMKPVDDQKPVRGESVDSGKPGQMAAESDG